MNSTFKALDDPTRRKILEILKEGDRTAGEIADTFEMTSKNAINYMCKSRVTYQGAMPGYQELQGPLLPLE